MSHALPTRDAIEEFVYREAALIDERRFDDWLALFDSDCRYLIVTPDIKDPEHASPDTKLFLVADDRQRLLLRVNRLRDATAHAESPPSKTRHCTSNVRFALDADGHVVVRANFITYRSRLDETVCFPGHMVYRLRSVDDGFRILEKRCMIDTDTLAQQRTVALLL